MISCLVGPFFQLLGQLHGRRQGRSYARLPPQRPANHSAAKEVLRPHAGDLQIGEEAPPGLHASDGGR